IGGGDGMQEQRLFRTVEAVDVPHRRMEREHRVQLRRRGEVFGELAALADIGRIADRRDRVQAVGRTALDDEDEAPVGRRAGKGHAGAEGGGEDGRGAEGDEAATGKCGHQAYLRMNSGETSIRARPWPGLSARAIDWVVPVLSVPGKSWAARCRA